MTARITISLPEQDLARIDALARERDLTRSELIREATGHYVTEAATEERDREQHEAGKRFLAHLEKLSGLPTLDDRPTLEILREMRGPLDPREPWDDEGADIP